MMRVLVFDDDAAVGRLVVRVANMMGLEAASVTDAGAFAERLRGDAPQLVMLDLQLGSTDGVQQLRWLAEQQYLGALVLMSGFDARVLRTAKTLGQSLGLRVESVLEKPVRVEQLEEMLTRVKSASESMSAGRLLEAVAGDELSLEFQPVVSRHPRTLKKLEALVRWDHPVTGQIAPGRFLPLAEGDTTVIDALTNWVVGAAVDAYQVMRELGISVPLSVNMSTQNLHDLALPDRIEQRMRAAGMPAEHLCLEITESAAFKDAARTMDILSRIRLKGMLLSIDDFGTGYSSLKMLRQMPFTEIKIDQSFVGDAATSRDSRAIVKSIIDLAANMEMACVAEGVEDEKTADLLESLGLRDMQGYLIAAPMAIENIPSWLSAWTRAGAAEPMAQIRSMVGTASTWMSEREAAPSVSAAPDPGVLARLSPRQLEVMQVLSEGCSAKEIARRLGISIGTVKVHLSLAYSVLGARNRIEAVTRAGFLRS